MFLSLITTEPTGMDSILAQLSNLTSVMGNVFNLITANAYLAFFAAVGLIAAGVHVFRLIKSAAR